MAIKNKERLAAEGFLAIRNLLSQREEGGVAAALIIAEALHNMPVGHDPFLEEMTCENIMAIAKQYPNIRSIQNLIECIEIPHPNKSLPRH